jgi:hypothetical protein
MPTRSEVRKTLRKLLRKAQPRIQLAEDLSEADLKQRLQELNVSDPTLVLGACHYEIDGLPECGDFTQTQCNELEGKWHDGHLCPGE